MSTSNPIDVIAADVKTGTVLDQNLEWFSGDEGQTKWKRRFGSRAEAIAFCKLEVQKTPDVEYWLLDGSNHCSDRIVNDKWKT